MSEPSVILLDEGEIKKFLGPSHDINLHIFGSIPSTQDAFKKMPMTIENKISFCLAEHQTQGRGRFGRVWQAPLGANINFSCRWPTQKSVKALSGLGLCVGLAVIHALKAFGLENLALKWPNDLYYQGKKLGGVLVETRAETSSISEVIIGIGLNVNLPASQDLSIQQPWTSIQMILGHPQDRNLIAALLIKNLMKFLPLFAEQGLAAFQTEWQQHDYLAGKMIRLLIGADHISGTAEGIDVFGHLLVRANGVIQSYSAGEASLSA